MRIGHLRNKLILASLVLIVPFVIWNVRDQISQFRKSPEAAIAAQQETGRHIADACAACIDNVVALERTVGTILWGEHKIPGPEASAHLKKAASSFPAVEHLYALDTKGVVFAGDTPNLAGADNSKHHCVREVMEGTEWALGDIFVMSPDRGCVFHVATGIRDGTGKLRGIVLAEVGEENIEKAMRHDIIRADRVIITDSKGVVAVAYGGRELSWQQRKWSDRPRIRRALAGKPSTVEHFRMPDGQVMLGAVEPIRELGWAVAAFTPREEVIGPIRHRAFLRGTIVALIVGLMIGMAVYLGNRTAKPVLDLALATQGIGRGDLATRADVRTGDELELLGNGFNEMVIALQQRTTELNSALGAARRESETASALYSVAHSIIATIDLQERLQAIARALASLCTVKRCVIFLRRGNRLVGAAAWGVSDPEVFRGVTLDMSEKARLSYQAMVTGAPIIVPDESKERYLDPRLAAEWSVKGYLALPLVLGQHVVGFAVLDNPGEYPHFEDKAIETSRGLAALAAAAIENAQAFEKERNIAQALQTSLLPAVCDTYGAFRFACEYHAALEVAQLGGDFYDFIQLPDGRVGVVIADVSGKGLEAAVFTAMGKYTLRAFVSEDPDPGPVLTRTNDALVRTGADWGFVTMFYGLLDPQTGNLVYANAGHPPCVAAYASGKTLLLPSAERQPPLGILPDMEYVQTDFHLDEGDVLVGYTDGVIEARRDAELFEVERLASLVSESRHLPPEEIARGIYEAVLDYSRRSLQDDIALMVIKREQG